MRTIHTDNVKIKLKSAKRLGTDEFGNVIEVDVKTPDYNVLIKRLEKLENTVNDLVTITNKNNITESTQPTTNIVEENNIPMYIATDENIKALVNTLLAPEGVPFNMLINNEDFLTASKVKNIDHYINLIDDLDKIKPLIGRGVNANLNDIDVSRVTNFRNLFSDNSNNQMDFCGRFNGDISNWNMNNAIDLSDMFRNNKMFNQNINNWKFRKLKNLHTTFLGATSFNQPLNKWNVSNVDNFTQMFKDATSFNQNISNWIINDTANKQELFYNCPIQEDYKTKYK